MALSGGVTSALGAASRSAVERIFERLPGYWGAKRWLGKKNRYASDCIENIKLDQRSGSVANSQLADYIAGTAALHAMDGWSLLGRALLSHVKGDAETATHLAYYAELRAAIATLAFEGVGVFDKMHFVVDSPRSVRYVGNAPGTHVFAWEALDNWAQSSSAATLLLDVIKPDGRTALTEWLSAFSTTPASDGLVVHSWIETWGLDLSRLTEDREARNLASYRPTRLHSGGAIPIEETLAFLRDFWDLAEPTATGAFQRLDAFLLRQALQRKFKSLHPTNRSVKQARHAFARQVDAMLHSVGPAAYGAFDWRGFLLGEESPAMPQLLEQAGGRLAAGEKGHDVQVIARASLLLRLASGAGRRVLERLSAPDREKFGFWVQPMAEQLGICAPGDYPSSSTDFWADIQDALSATEGWMDSTDASQRSLYKFSAECAPQSMALTSMEIAGVWALNL